MLETQIYILNLWNKAGERLRQQYAAADADRDRGEVTATTALIFLLVAAAIAAGTIIATKITANANNVPTP